MTDIFIRFPHSKVAVYYQKQFVTMIRTQEEMEQIYKDYEGCDFYPTFNYTHYSGSLYIEEKSHEAKSN